MRHIKLIPIIAVAAILLTSCGKKSSQGKMIPQDAAIIVDINTKSLTSKLSWDEIKQTNWYSQLMSDSSINQSHKMFLEDPKKTGIDLTADISMFATKPMQGGEFVVVGTIKDSKAFAEFIKSMHSTAASKKEGDLNLLQSDKDVIGWNDNRFAFVTSTQKSEFGTSALQNDSITKTVPLSNTGDQLATYCKKLFSLKDDSSLYENEKFAKLVNEDGEVHFWMNAKALASGNAAAGMMSMLKIDKFLEDNITTMSVNFEDGKITAKNKFYAGKELSDILKKNADGKMNKDLLKKISSQNIAAVVSMHFRPESFIEMIKLMGLDGFINLMLAQQGISLDDFAKAIKGDMVYAFTDLVSKKDSTYNLNDSTGNITLANTSGGTFLLATTIGDKDAFNKILSAAKKMGSDSAVKNTSQKNDDKLFVLSNKQDVMNNYFTNKETDHTFISRLSDHPFGGYIDVQMIMKTYQPKSTDSAGLAMYQKSIAMWNNAYVTGGEFKDGGLISNFEVNLIDKTTNSLKQLNKYFDALSIITKEEKKKHKADVEIKDMPPQDSASGNNTK